MIIYKAHILTRTWMLGYKQIWTFSEDSLVHILDIKQVTSVAILLNWLTRSKSS